MSERTTIGGTVYEAIGSSSSNLLLKCNGTARIQWGNKLIDLIKNGKIASGDSLELIFIVSDESEIGSDGVYLLTTEESTQLWVSKNGNKYNLTDTDLYISASKLLDLTVDLKKQALDNIGMYYDTLEDVQSAGIQNGIVYVTDTKILYTIKDGVIEEFEAKLKTVTVEKEENEGEVINSSVKIILSILDDEYLILANKRIVANYPIYVKDSALIGSENADSTLGYRLYMLGGVSYLDVDEINVRNGFDIKLYKEILFDDLKTLINSEELEPLEWYLITDYRNPWKIVNGSESDNRPILVRALNKSTLYEKGYLFKDHRVQINYDSTYIRTINVTNADGTTSSGTTKGLITWMKDSFNNEANFDFLNYSSGDENNVYATLHTNDENLDQSIFPKNSHDNKLIAYDIKGLCFTETEVDGLKVYYSNDANACTIDFLFDDSGENVMLMYNNTIECRGLVLTSTCTSFCNNTLEKSIKLNISESFNNNTILSIYSTTDSSTQDITNFSEITDNTIFNNCTINTINSTFKNISNSTLDATFDNVIFKNLSNCTFESGDIENVVSYYDLSGVFNSADYPLLYITNKRKEIYISNDKIEIIVVPEVVFYRGMIIMHSGITDIPPGWAICDGGTYEFNGVSSTTPDLRNRFIKAVATVEEIKETDNEDINENGELTLKKEHLPEHSHPHKAHTHEMSELSGSTGSSGTLSITSDSTYAYNTDTTLVLTEASLTTELDVTLNTKSTNVVSDVSWKSVSSEGGDHTHSITISGGEIQNATSEEETQEWENKPIKPIPNYYSLIFIMKL